MSGLPTYNHIILITINSATGVGAWRLDQLVEAFFPSSVNMDYTYSIGFVSSAIEVNVAVISACCPALKALITRFAPRFLGTSGRGTYGKSRNTRYGHGTYIRSNVDPNDSYELGQKIYNNKQHTEISGGNSHGGRLPTRSKTAESLSLSDDDGIIAGAMGSIAIVKTTNVSVQRDRRDDHPEKASSVDSLVECSIFSFVFMVRVAQGRFFFFQVGSIRLLSSR